MPNHQVGESRTDESPDAARRRLLSLLRMWKTWKHRHLCIVLNAYPLRRHLPQPITHATISRCPDFNHPLKALYPSMAEAPERPPLIGPIQVCSGNSPRRSGSVTLQPCCVANATLPGVTQQCVPTYAWGIIVLEMGAIWFAWSVAPLTRVNGSPVGKTRGGPPAGCSCQCLA